MVLLVKKNVRGGIGSVMGDRYKKLDDNKKIFYVHANNVHGWAMSQSLPYDEVKFGTCVGLEEIINAPDYSDIGFLRR